MQAARKINFDILENVELCDEIHDVLRNAWSKGDFTSNGYGNFFQNEYAQFCGSIYAFSSSLRNSLKETLTALQLPPRSEVICPSWISVEHVQSILSIGLTPIFAEINPYTLSLDYSDVSHKLNAQTSAVILNYPFGFPTDPCTYVELCKHHNIKLVEIVPSAIGSTVDNQFIGTFGDVGIFEMHPNQKYSNKKDCMLVTDSAEIHQHFSKKGLHEFSQLDGVLGMHFLETFDKHQSSRKKIAQRYHQCFTKILHLSVLYELANANWVHQMYPIRVSHKIREALVRELKHANIDFELPQTPAHLYSYIQKVLRPAQLMTTERLMREIIFLPIVPDTSDAEQEQIIEIIMTFFQKNDLYL